MSLNYVVISELATDGSSADVNGTATFSPNQACYATGIGLVANVPIQAQIVAGQLQLLDGSPVQLLATDNTLSFTTLTGYLEWSVQLVLAGVEQQPWAFFLPYDTLGPGPVALFSLANTPAGGGGGGGSGTVTSVAVESANGFTGTVADDTTTPQITLSVSPTGVLKGNGTAITPATPGTDYVAPTGSGASLTGITATQVGADASGAAAAVQALAALRANNLSDLASASTARTNLGLGTAATQASSAFDASGAASAAQAASLQKASNLSDLASASTARTNLGLGSAATQGSSAFDAAGSAAAAQANAEAASLPVTDDLSAIATANATAGNVAMNGHKLTGLANGSASGDSAAFGQIPTSAGAIGGLLAASNLSDVANAGTARTNLGLGTAATQAATAFDASGAAAAAQAASDPLGSAAASAAFFLRVFAA